MVLTDDNFATIVAAVAAGRRVYDNIRKFIVYIFAHATPEVTPFLVFALAGGADPAAADRPAAARLRRRHRDAAGAGARARARPSRGSCSARRGRASEGIITRRDAAARLALPRPDRGRARDGRLLLRPAAGRLAAQATRPATGTPLHHAYLQATTMTFLSMVVGQIGTAFAARTERASLRSIGVFSNRLLLWGIAFELVLAALLDLRAAVSRSLLGTAALPARRPGDPAALPVHRLGRRRAAALASQGFTRDRPRYGVNRRPIKVDRRCIASVSMLSGRRRCTEPARGDRWL